MINKPSVFKLLKFDCIVCDIDSLLYSIIGNKDNYIVVHYLACLRGIDTLTG